MPNKLLAVYAVSEAHKDEICFIVIAESMNRMGWPLMATYGNVVAKDYKPVRVTDLGPAPDRDVAVLDVFGPARSLPPELPFAVPAYQTGRDLPPGLR